ncbi:nondiscriminating glutamyl-tRNA synthetase [Caldalkalibacillus uzonensis]|uniref:Glutamate--tRNA ligase n=2 Tax=Caldalkalibacillus uzonensis TaxID=353224 RepID=A0ABU0CUR6_9BACI|nr:nondiscriminating glutamyl-tRNA synthetase [Caldalkalibacillus uzonensis]
MKQVRVRYAPSPTGHLHIGNARTALFNYLFARHYQGQFVIRIEDTDQKRNVEGGEINQLNYLKWLGIDWDESIDKPGAYGPYRQSERLDIYRQYAQMLMDQGLAYKCYCTEEELERERERMRAQGIMPRYSGKCRNLTAEEQQALEAEGRKPSIRFRVPENKTYTFNDMVKGPISFESSDFGDFVIVKKDGWPTYNFAVVVDDHLMEITHVLRGEDHISNTPRQMMIYEALGWEIPTFGHMTLIVNENRKKLSKRDETIIQFIEQYHELGYLPEALFNFITLLGWSPAGEEEIFSREEFIRMFDEKRLSKSPAVFDANKLAWMNNHYIKQLSADEVVELALPYLQKQGYLPQELTPEQHKWATQLILLYQEQMRYGAEITKLAALFFKEEITYDSEAMTILSEEQVPAVLQSFLAQVEQVDPFEADNIKQAIKAVQKETGAKGKKLFMPIRVACTGQAHGPDLTQSLTLLGRDKVRSRLREALKQLQTV